MRITVAQLAFLVACVAMAGQAQGADISATSSLRPMLEQVSNNCSGAESLTYESVSTTAAESRVLAGHQDVAPMVRDFNAKRLCQSNAPDQAEGLIVALDAVSVVAAQEAAAQCSLGLVHRKCIEVSSDGDCPGCRGNKYCFIDYQDALRVLLTGMHHDAGQDLRQQSCNSAPRRALANQWHKLFQGDCVGDTCSSIHHVFRGADNDDASMALLRRLGLPERSASAFCNGSDTQDNDPIRRACTAQEDVCTRNGTLGLVLPIRSESARLTTKTRPGARFTPKRTLALQGNPKTNTSLQTQKTCAFGRPDPFGFCPLTKQTISPAWATLLTKGWEQAAVPSTTDISDLLATRPPNKPALYFYGIHSNKPNSGGRRSCNEREPNTQRLCLAQASPCSLSLVHGSANSYAGTTTLSVNGVAPTEENVSRLMQSELAADSAYPLTYPLWLNSAQGFEDVNHGPAAALVDCLQDAKLIQTAAASTGLFPLRTAASCRDFDERTYCGWKTNNDACRDNLPEGAKCPKNVIATHEFPRSPKPHDLSSSSSDSNCEDWPAEGGSWSGSIVGSSRVAVFCSYEWVPGSEPAPSASEVDQLIARLQSLSHVASAEASCPVVVPSGATTGELARVVHERIGGGFPPAPTNLDNDVRIVVIDTAAVGFETNASDTSPHGRAVGLTARLAACGSLTDPCPVSIDNKLALPIVSAMPMGTSWQVETNFVRGGFYGTRARLAMMLDKVANEVLLDPRPTIVNLSVGWHGKHDCNGGSCPVRFDDDTPSIARFPRLGLGHGGVIKVRQPATVGLGKSATATHYPDDERQVHPATLAVFNNLAKLRCAGVLINVAAGNAQEEDREGPLMPAGWEQLAIGPNGDLQIDCEVFGSDYAGKAVRGPLVYAVGGSDYHGRALPNARNNSLPKLSALGLGVVVGDKLRGGYSQVLSGSSMSTAVVSGAAARLWSERLADEPSYPGDEVMRELYKGGVPLGRNAQMCPATVCEDAPDTACPVNCDQEIVEISGCTALGCSPTAQPYVEYTQGELDSIQKPSPTAGGCNLNIPGDCPPLPDRFSMLDAPWLFPQPDPGPECATCQILEEHGLDTLAYISVSLEYPINFAAVYAMTENKGVSSLGQYPVPGSLIKSDGIKGYFSMSPQPKIPSSASLLMQRDAPLAGSVWAVSEVSLVNWGFGVVAY